jgi:hypothetical protein
MKKLLCAYAALIMAFTTISAFAATDVTGTWTAVMKGPGGGPGGDNGGAPGGGMSFTFKQAGTTLTGSMQGPQGEAVAISEGKVDGDKISFKVSFNGMTITHEGTVNAAGDEIKLTSKSDQGDFPGGEMTLTRSKATATLNVVS